MALLRPRADRYAAIQPGAADVLLVIEVSDTTLKFDQSVKARLHARHGVPEFWVVDLKNRRLETLRAPQGGEYCEPAVHTPGVVAIPGVGIDIDLKGLFL